MTFSLPPLRGDDTPESYLRRLAEHPDFAGKFNTSPLLNRAFGKVHGPREKEYGNKYINFGDIAAFWQVYLRPKLREGAEITRTDVALMQDLTKTARLMKSPTHEDGKDDKVGYILCLDEIQAEEFRREHEGNSSSEGQGGDEQSRPL